MKIRIQKRGEVPGGAPANQKANHIAGQEQPPGLSLPIDYEIEGELTGSIRIGYPVVVSREIRNGIRIPGTFITTPVTEVSSDMFRTKNSVYTYSLYDDTASSK